ncbi:MAG: YggS family pyridoxal phosphate-dependent enzyme [Lachnospiraceae bacterium]|nr:YggS family pyridoxal phosphate-dependent enzyme [Lachnospiraceae bacterium]
MVQKKIKEAAARAGRNPEDITLIAVSKTKPVLMLQEAYDAGQRVFGENKVQEILEKEPVLPEDISWHMIGHLQRNKVKQVIGKAAMIHSVDSLRLAEEIEKEAAKQDILCSILIEINIAAEESKYGILPEEAPAFAKQLSAFPHLRVKGLMTVAPFTENPEENRKYFRKMQQLAVDIKQKNIDNICMETLSMGMTGDYEIAIEEGATMVRVGTGIFGERNYNK